LKNIPETRGTVNYGVKGSGEKGLFFPKTGDIVSIC
jgi:hypothetical protein